MEKFTERNTNGQAMLILKNAFKINMWNVNISYPEGKTSGTYTITGDAVEKFAAFEEAEEKGRLLRLPCNVGDVVYKPVTRYYKGVQRIDGPYVLELVVKKIQITSDGMEFSTKSCDSFTLENIGSTIFLAREEAEEKLKEMYN